MNHNQPPHSATTATTATIATTKACVSATPQEHHHPNSSPKDEPAEITEVAEACFAATRALCNRCGRLVDAKIVFRGERVYLVKACPEHGLTQALISSDRGWYLRSLAYNKPGTIPLHRAVAVNQGCPDSCGLCPSHQQHTCVPILEITDRCDLDCPICLVADTPPYHLTLPQVQSIMDRLVHDEGRLNMLTLSGGEPTCHPQFLEILDATRRPEIGVVSVSTNGLSLLHNDDLLGNLLERGVVISLQFDGIRPTTYQRLRGRAELAQEKLQLIERIIAQKGRLSLTVTLARGINEDEIPAILDLFFAHDEILSVMIQPIAYAGRAQSFLPHNVLDSITTPEVVHLLAQGSGGVLAESDFSPLPCSHPSCFSLTYLLKTSQGRLVSLPSLIDTENYLDIIKNQALFGTDWDSLSRVKDALYGLWSSNGVIPNREAVLQTVRQILLDLNRLGPQTQHRDVLSLGLNHVKSIFIHHFMDRATFDLSRAVKCCNHYPQPDGRLLPACIRNNLPRIQPIKDHAPQSTNAPCYKHIERL